MGWAVGGGLASRRGHEAFLEEAARRPGLGRVGRQVGWEASGGSTVSSEWRTGWTLGPQRQTCHRLQAAPQLQAGLPLPRACPLSPARASRLGPRPGPQGQGLGRARPRRGRESEGLRKQADREIGFRRRGACQAHILSGACALSTFITAQLGNFISAEAWRHLWAWPLPAAMGLIAADRLHTIASLREPITGAGEGGGCHEAHHARTWGTRGPGGIHVRSGRRGPSRGLDGGGWLPRRGRAPG